MFSNEDLKCLDPKYFSIITKDAYDVTIMSRNTGHYWYLHNPEYPEQGTVIIIIRIMRTDRGGFGIICTAGRTPCGRRYGVSGDMIGGRFCSPPQKITTNNKKQQKTHCKPMKEVIHYKMDACNGLLVRPEGYDGE